ncbi:sulfatase [Larkinella sp. VNQ87]|uniref:sulfatase family protein n=1 Tax=Larkinella sp. VNQ87 TaxID=3400921 RepID=UPI003C08CF93
MQRRDFLTQTLTALAAAGVSGPLLSGKSARAVRNIVLLIGDDHSARVMGSYGNPLIRTPHLDRLAREGMRFTNAFCQSPVCSASRQSLLTGTYPHRTGVNLLFTSFSDEKNYTIAEHLQSHGYRTAAIGKMHTNNQQPHGFQVRKDTAEYTRWLKAKGGPKSVPGDVPTRDMSKTKGFSVEQWVNPGVRPEPLYDADALDTYLAREAISFVEEKSDKPFLLFVGFHAPHAPMNFPVEFAGRYRPEDLPPGRFGPEDVPWTPAIFKDLTELQKREIVAGYYTCVEYLDKNVGLVLNALDASGHRDDTLLVYISDHGYLLGDHNRFEKHTMWEPTVRSPLLIRMPGIKPGVCDELVELVDLVPTFAEAASTPALPGIQGKSLVPVLQKPAQRRKAGFREAVFSEYLVDNMAMLRTTDWKYVFSTNQYDLGLGYAIGENRPTGYVQRLYDLRRDPDELHNLAGEPAHRRQLETLRNQLLAVFRETHLEAHQLPPNLTAEQQLAWFCEPRDEVSDLEKRLFPHPERYEKKK